jgi:hypothetical protein
MGWSMGAEIVYPPNALQTSGLDLGTTSIMLVTGPIQTTGHQQRNKTQVCTAGVLPRASR